MRDARSPGPAKLQLSFSLAERDGEESKKAGLSEDCPAVQASRENDGTGPAVGAELEIDRQQFPRQFGLTNADNDNGGSLFDRKPNPLGHVSSKDAVLGSLIDQSNDVNGGTWPPYGHGN